MLAARVTSRQVLLQDWATSHLVLLKDNLRERRATTTIAFDTAPQPSFNRNFAMLADDIRWNKEGGYETFILSHNKAQIERLDNIFHQVGKRSVEFRSADVVLHEGFVDSSLKVCLYPDHQIFDRFHKYSLKRRRISLTSYKFLLSMASKSFSRPRKDRLFLLANILSVCCEQIMLN